MPTVRYLGHSVFALEHEGKTDRPLAERQSEGRRQCR